MNNDIINYNLSTIYDNPDSTFTVDKEGKLDTISKFNFLGRFIEWIRDLASGGKRSQHTNEVIIDTLENVVKNLNEGQPNSFYFPDNDRLTFTLLGKSSVHCYKWNHPLNLFADQVINSSLKKKPDILRLTQQIKDIALPIIQFLNQSERDKLFQYPFNV